MVSPGARKSTLPSGSRRRHLVALSLAMTALLCAISAPRVHAQNPTDQWVEDGGSIVASPMMLTVREGESAAYSVNLTAAPTEEAEDDSWWVFVHVDGQRRAYGRYKSIHWVPSIGREFYRSDWSAENGKDIRITAEEDDNELDEVYIFTHELWDHDAYCPEGLHGEGDVARVVVTVIDDDGPNAPQPELSIGDASVEEGGTARFEVRLDTASERAVTVHYRTSNGTALADSDYERVDDTLLTIPAETRIAIIEVQTKEDDDYEADETFTVRLSSPAGATIGDGNGTGEGTITNDDAAPEVFIENDATVDEGDPARFEVKLSAQSVLPVRVSVATMDGTAVAGSDYTAIDRTLTFQPGTDSLTVDVSTRDDNADEPETETFTLALSAPDGATLRNNQRPGTGTIRDNDDLPEVSIGNAPAVTEEGTALFPVTLTAASGKMVTVMYGTVDGTAVAGSDYMTTTGTLEFSPGTDRLTIEVPTSDDKTSEPEENFTVELSAPTEATLGEKTGEGTIRDDDGQPDDGGGDGGDDDGDDDDDDDDDDGGTTPTLSLDDVSAEEGETAQFTVTLTGTSNQTVTVDVQTSDGTAEAGADYTTKSETLTFSAGQTTATFSVDTIDDQDQESDENFTVTLSNPSGATIDDDTGTGTITDNDGGGGSTPTLSIDDASAEEGETAQFTVTLTGTSNQTVTVDVQTSDGTAEAGADYTTKSETLTFSAGQTTATFSVDTIDDQDQESDENFTVTLSNPSGATIDDDTGTGTITDNDGGGGSTPTLSIDDASAEEGETAQFTVTLIGTSNQTVTVDVQTSDGTAEAGADYTTKSETLTFSAGQTTATFSVDTIDDQDQESDENFTVTLTNPTGATLDDDAGTGTITDNDGDDGEPEPVPALPLLGQLLLALGLAAGGARLARHRGVSPPRAV